MGIPNLWSSLQDCGQDVTLSRLAEIIPKDQREACGSRFPHQCIYLGIDVAGWLFHARKGLGGKSPWLRVMFWRMCRLSTVPFVFPVFVFDGVHRPANKRGKQVYRDIFETPGQISTFVSDFKTIIDAFGFMWIDAPGEAEAELADLNHRGLIDCIMSDDVDCFLFGAEVVVRNWGANLSGSKARSDYLSGGNVRQDNLSGMEGQGKPTSSQKAEPMAPNAHITASPDKYNVTFFRASTLKDKLNLSRGGLILVAILSGGDYDVQGLFRCGTKIALGLAKAGFGDELLEGAEKFFPALYGIPTKENPSKRLSPSTAQSLWTSFLEAWRYRVCEELATNRAGFQRSRLKKLSESIEMRELLSTEISLQVLQSYIWPNVSGRQSLRGRSRMDLKILASIMETKFDWTSTGILDSFRSNVWEGCIVRHLSGNVIVDDVHERQRHPLYDRTNSNQPKTHQKSTKITSYFKKDETRGDHGNQAEEENGSSYENLLLSIIGERQTSKHSFKREVLVVCNVDRFVNVTLQGITGLRDKELQAKHNFKTLDQKGSEAQPVPKKRYAASPYVPAKFWVSEELVDRHATGSKLLQRYRIQQVGKGKYLGLKDYHSTPNNAQTSLSNYFRATFKEPSSALASSNEELARDTTSGEVYGAKRNQICASSEVHSSSYVSTSSDLTATSLEAPSQRDVSTDALPTQVLQTSLLSAERSFDEDSTELVYVVHGQNKAQT